MNPFRKRSSLPSSFVTGLVGWVCFMFVGILIFNIPVSSVTILIIAVATAIIQVIILRTLFFVFRMQKHILIGAFWGLLSAIGLYFITEYLYPVLKGQRLYWLIIYLYIGAPVGAFLSYFYRDDQKILSDSDKGDEETYGRDAHWLEPFVFGAIAYLVAFLPFENSDLTVKVLFIGAITGVFAAGSSHFSPDKWKHSIPGIILIIAGLGSLFGVLTGILFRPYASYLLFSPIIHGLVAGILTFLLTFLRGKQLAIKEAKGTL